MKSTIELSEPVKRNISELTNWDKNPRTVTKDSYARLIEQIKRLGIIYKPLLINQQDIVLGGNMRLRAFKELGIEEVWCTRVLTDNEAQMMELALSDNDQIGVTDEEAVAAFNALHPIKSELFAINSAPMKLVSSVIKSLSPEPEAEEDEAPEVSKDPPQSVKGVVYQLGRHRIMCGDATDFSDIGELLNGADIDTIFTDPPYGMNAVSSSGVLSKNYDGDIMGDGDNTVAIKSFEVSRILKAKHEVWWGANYYSSSLPDAECWIVWDKNNGESDQTDAELAWTNLRSVVRVFTQASEKVNRVHPTQKPVSLAVWAFHRFKCAGNVLDLFLGSGSTLIACEQSERTCYGMELDPRFVDVVRKRYATFTQPDKQLPDNWAELTPSIGG
jgi:DNA modification methylase